MSRFLACAAAVAVLSLPFVARADEDEKVPLDKVAKAVLDAVKAKYPKAEIVSAEKGDEDGTKVFELDLKEGDKTFEVAFTPEGKFVSAEETIKEGDLPAKVKEAFQKKYGDAKILEAEKETTGEGDSAKVVYEIVTEKGKDKVEASFDPDGKFIEEEKK